MSRPSTRFLTISASMIGALSLVATTSAAQPTGWGAPAPTTGPVGTGGPSPGLTAPPPMNKSPSATQQQLERSEREDAGRGLEWVWLQAEGGGAYASANAISNDKLLLPGPKEGGGAGLVGLAVGARVLFFTFGLRGRMTFLSDYRIVSVVPEIGAHVPLGRWEPYIFLGAGYAALSGLPKYETKAPSVAGLDARLGLGVDHYLTPTFSVGGLLTSDFLFLGRSAMAPVAPKGSGTGVVIAGSAVLGLHF